MAVRCMKSLLLKLFALLSTLLAALVMGMNKQSSDFGGLVIIATYKIDPTFKFFVFGNAVVALYCLLSLPLLFKNHKHLMQFVFDMLATTLTIAAAAAATTIGYLAELGNIDIGWAQVCPFFEPYCVRAGVSIGLSFLGFLLLFLLCVVSHNNMIKTSRMCQV